MKKALKITIICSIGLMLNSCFLFGGGKSKCGDCPSWSHQDFNKEESTTSNEKQV